MVDRPFAIILLIAALVWWVTWAELERARRNRKKGER